MTKPPLQHPGDPHSLPLPRLASIDLLRAVAVLMVATAHFGRAFSAGTAQFCADYGKLGVEVFFVISGYVIPYSLARSGYSLGPGNFGPLQVFAAKRFLRIHPPYLAALALTLAITWPWRHALGLPQVDTWGSLAQSAAYLHFPSDNPVFWSLLVELEYYALIAFIFPLLAHRRLAVGMATFGALLLLARVAGEPGDAFHLPQYLPRFAVGFAVFCFTEGRIGWRRLALLLAGLWLWDRSGPEATAALLTGLAIAAFAKCGTWHREDHLPPVLAPLLFIGAISYSFFLVHLPVGGKILIALRFLLGPGEAWGFPVFLAALAGATGMAFVFYRLVEAPCHRLAGRMGTQKETPSAPPHSDA
ncbi:Peptidoglycan/LPS O-acetylase OafA/YrhL, contains acyltransferase and SGNH-hydrolase domains [Verrucomicrobium sp. GAS474]|uniref:acyltransferase family protein n=1 Tax=Verrucomicrobium sp. GAS474 TaxID=1882831 RepID=UPI00087B0E97|nr:acyltransferase [Verrucomicrobium sp. GAS474]SDT91932.1 Peptidoglycan/LPS O-acetylase OafA/YrhL, contains acyltransferase and SGNH-hydrolase domains [Verrucomicrobium sp. GAS474]